MKRKPVNPVEMAPVILGALPKGILLTTKSADTADTMTIGWGTMGTDWSIPVFTVFVRESRFTKELLDQSGEFTINVPMPGQNVSQIIAYCGTRSGRDVDKFEQLHLHTIPGVRVDVPAIAELPLTLECKVIYRQDQDPAAIGQDILDRHYPKGDFHTAYTAQIVDAYLLEED